MSSLEALKHLYTHGESEAKDTAHFTIIALMDKGYVCTTTPLKLDITERGIQYIKVIFPSLERWEEPTP